MLLHHARRPARFTAEGALVPLREQDRRRWDTAAIRTGIQVLQAALAQDRLGEFQAQARSEERRVGKEGEARGGRWKETKRSSRGRRLRARESEREDERES